jgi:hypothetical protein
VARLIAPVTLHEYLSDDRWPQHAMHGGRDSALHNTIFAVAPFVSSSHELRVTRRKDPVTINSEATACDAIIRDVAIRRFCAA